MIHSLHRDCTQVRGCIMITFAGIRAYRWGNRFILRGVENIVRKASGASKAHKASKEPAVTYAANSGHTKTFVASRFVESDQRLEKGHPAIGRCPVSF